MANTVVYAHTIQKVLGAAIARINAINPLILLKVMIVVCFTK